MVNRYVHNGIQDIPASTSYHEYPYGTTNYNHPFRCRVGVIGGSGLKELFDNGPEKTKKYLDDGILEVEKELLKGLGHDFTVEKGKVKEVNVVFVNRHGKGHSTAPHEISYGHLMGLMKHYQVRKIIGVSSSGIINTEIKKNSIVVPNDFGAQERKTIYEKPFVVHVSLDQPYCPVIREKLIEKGKEVVGERLVDHGVYYNTEGPSFETKAEIRSLKMQGYDLVGMTNAYEAMVAREFEICYAGLITADNYACGIQNPETAEEPSLEIEDVRKSALEKQENVKEIIRRTIPEIAKAECDLCPEAAHKGLMSEKEPRWFSGPRDGLANRKIIKRLLDVMLSSENEEDQKENATED